MEPTAEHFAILAEHQGVVLPPHRVTEAAEGYLTLAAQIVEMRAIPFSFLESVIEPATADRWIDAGGVSR